MFRFFFIPHKSRKLFLKLAFEKKEYIKWINNVSMRFWHDNFTVTGNMLVKEKINVMQRLNSFLVKINK